MASFAALFFERFGSRVFRHWGGARVGRDPCVRAWHLIGFPVPAPPPQACSVRKHGEHLCKYFGTSDELMDEAARRERGGGGGGGGRLAASRFGFCSFPRCRHVSTSAPRLHFALVSSSHVGRFKGPSLERG